jgi:FixJ family two-component response regulator
MKVLFICDDKEEWNLLTNLFHAHFSGVDLVCVLKGQEAIDTIMFDANFRMILIECGLKESDPTDLAEEIYETIGVRPLIFIGTEAMIKDRVRDDFYNKYENVGLYQKPYDPKEFVEVLKQAMEWSKQQEFEDSVVELNPEEFLPLKLRNFYLYDQVPFDVYIELTKTKYLKAISANKKYPQSTIQDFRKRNIRYLYLEKNEHLNFLESSIKKISQSFHQIKSDDRTRRMQTLVAATLVIHQYLRDVGVSDTLKGFR